MKKIHLIFLALLTMTTTSGATESQPLRAGGSYIVESIQRVDSGYFQVIFKSEVQTGSFDKLILESEHVHFSIREGQTIRISAEVLSVNGAEAEVSQVLLFLPHVQGTTPVWLLSRKNNSSDLLGARYIEMHLPQSDYAIF